jgi:hypothetical protein
LQRHIANRKGDRRFSVFSGGGHHKAHQSV